MNLPFPRCLIFTVLFVLCSSHQRTFFKTFVIHVGNSCLMNRFYQVKRKHPCESWRTPLHHKPCQSVSINHAKRRRAQYGPLHFGLRTNLLASDPLSLLWPCLFDPPGSPWSKAETGPNFRIWVHKSGYLCTLGTWACLGNTVKTLKMCLVTFRKVQVGGI